MEREVPLFCGEAVVSYRVANVAELERKASPTFLLRVASFRLALLRFASLCFALLRFASLSSASFCSASFRAARFCLAFALFCFISLWSD